MLSVQNIIHFCSATKYITRKIKEGISYPLVSMSFACAATAEIMWTPNEYDEYQYFLINLIFLDMLFDYERSNI